MTYECLKGLEPADFFHWFGQIAQIPHGSRKEEKIVAFLADFAKQRGFAYEIDETKNILIRVPATPGYEQQPSVLFQAHSDMVWRSDIPFDFETQPIELVRKDDRITANGTTLGADNAVGMATMLAIADGDYPHPELELLFTAAEEVGMVGIRAFDKSKLKSRRMVNMDCGDSHVLCVTSAGCIVGDIHKDYPLYPIPRGWEILKLTLTGGKGGHGGICANAGRACGGNLLGDLLLNKEVRLCHMAGSSAIIKHAEATVAMPIGAKDALQPRFAELKTIYQNTDPDWQLEIAPAQADTALSQEDSAKLILALNTLRTGQFRCDGNRPTTILTSGQLRSFALENGQLKIDFAVRSACDADQDLLFTHYKTLLQVLDLELVELSRYSGWQELPGSPWRKQFEAMHQTLFGHEIEIERCHGGIETGIILGAIPDMDAIGLAPTARGAHTTGEYLLIDEVMPYWQLITAVLAEKI